MKIAVDAMGGDNAPFEVVKGAVLAAEEDNELEIVLVGDEKQIEDVLSSLNTKLENISVLHASQVVGMDESATNAIRKKTDSSITKSVKLVADKKAVAVVSAGNTGAMVAASTVLLRTLEGVKRPGIVVLLPTQHGYCIIIDAGANLNCRPQHLFEYGTMASVFCKYILGIDNPRVGLLNVGEEEAKGNDLVKETFGLLSDSSLNFVGNVEGLGVVNGEADIIVCEGFVGNVMLKFFEGLTESFIATFEMEASKSPETKEGLDLCRPVLEKVRNKIDYAGYGGVPLLGVDGICIICHGRSNARAIHNAIKEAAQCSKFNVNDHIVSELQNNSQPEIAEYLS